MTQGSSESSGDETEGRFITDTEMRAECRDRRLRSLDFERGTRFAPGVLAQLTLLKTFQWLHFEGSRFEDADLSALGQVKPLKRLSLKECVFPEQSLRHLIGLPRLEDLWLENTPVTDAGLVHVARMTLLSQELNLSGTRITDAGLTLLGSLADLRYLSIRRTAATDAGILALAHLRRLTIFAGPEVGDRSGKVTEEGLEAFIKAQRDHRRQARHKAAAGAGRPAAKQPPQALDEAETEAAKQVLLGFFAAMTQWEVDCALHERKEKGRFIPPRLQKQARDRTESQLLQDYRDIMSTYCTDRKRVYTSREGLGAGWPPTYDDVDQLRFTEIEQPSSGRIAFYTNDWHDSRWQFVLLKKAGRWQLDNRKAWASGWTDFCL